MDKHINDQDLLQFIKQLESYTTLEDLSAIDSYNPSVEVGEIVVENNRIYVSNSWDVEQLPTIEAAEPVRLKVNGKDITGPVKVQSTDKIEWEIVQDPMFHIWVSEDQMVAFFQLVRLENYVWNLCDQEASSHIVLTAEEDPSKILETVHLADVAQELEKRLLTQNLNLSGINQELIQPTYEPVEVAKGKKPVQSIDAELIIYFEEKIVSTYEEQNGIIDFRNHLKIPQVKKGEVIAKKIPPIEGSNGYNVYGQIISYEPPKDIVIITNNKDVIMTEDGHIIALSEGRPRIRGERVKNIDITSSHIVTGDVNFEYGNIVFTGDVIVYGNVMDDMVIESLGNVYIYGNVYKSTISATGSIFVKGNVLSSKLYSGYFGVIFNRLYMNTKKLLEILDNLRDAAKVLCSILDDKGLSAPFGRVIMTLIETKYQNIPKVSQEIIKVINQLNFLKVNEFQRMLEKVKQLLNFMEIQKMSSFDDLESIIHSLQETKTSFESMQEAKVQIEVDQSNYSNLKSNGDILIRKEGTVNSNLYSERNIIFYHKNATCRGGRLEANGKLFGASVEGNSPTFIKAGERISLNKITSGRVCVGRICEHITIPYTNFEAFIERSNLVIKGETEIYS